MMSATHGIKIRDLELNWFTDTYGEGWEEWRNLAALWISSFDRSIDHHKAAIVRFFEKFLVPNFITSPEQFLLEDAYDYKKFIAQEDLSERYKVRHINELSDFFDWVIKEHFSEPNDNGVLIPLINNPITKESVPVSQDESVYNPLPYSYIEELRHIVCLEPYGHFRDWKWAQEQTGNKRHNGQENGRTGDWFYVEESLIDKNDLDCTWRSFVAEKTKLIHINGYKKQVYKGAKLYQIWSPVRAMIIYIKLHLPLRTYQVRMLDSGEADTWRYDKGAWVINEGHSFFKGNEKYPWQKGVFRRIRIPEIGDVMTGLYINTNKTADRNKSELDRGYVIPWEHKHVLYWMEKMRDWQEKYNPISAPTSIDSLDFHHFGSTKTEVQREAIGDICFLFRNAPNVDSGERDKPVGASWINHLWYQLLKELEDRKYKSGKTLADGRKIRFTCPITKKTLFPLHSLRVSLITCYAMEGDIPAPVLSKLLVGHSRLIMTLYYTKITPSVIARKMEEAEKKMRDSEKETLRNFLVDAEIRQIEEKSVCNHLASVANILRVKNPAGWQEKNIGVCLAGGNTSKSVENPEVIGCWNGGELIKKATKTTTKLYGPVPHAAENCIRCRWFITDATYLAALTAHFNNLSYQASLSAKLATELEREKDQLLDEKYFCMEKQETFSEEDRLAKTQRRWEKQISDADEYCKDLIACFQVIKKIIDIEESRKDDDECNKLVATGATEDIKQYIKFFETESELWQLARVCEDAEAYPDLSDGLKKTPAILQRSNKLNFALMQNGYTPIFMNMDENMQLIAGNAMIRTMAKQYSQEEGTGFNNVANYIEAQQYLNDSGIFEQGIAELTANQGIPVLKMSDLLSVDAKGITHE